MNPATRPGALQTRHEQEIPTVTAPTDLSRGELDRASFVEWHQRIMAHDEAAPDYVPRSYPGYPRWPLDRPRPRVWPALDRILARRRCHRVLSAALPSRRPLGRLLWLAHGIYLAHGRGPVPSAGGLQALELYLVNLAEGWLPAGLYHYDRPGHHLSQIAAGAGREEWRSRVPSLGQVEGGALLWVCVGDGERVASKYGERGERFLLLEAGHLMQNLCLASASLRLATVPLGGYFEQDIARSFAMPAGDRVLYLGLCGRPV
jgi:SagB-type dehydrogenase family enzyme